MNALTAIANIMPESDKKAFIKHLSKKNKRHDVGNIDLFKSLETDDIKEDIVLNSDGKSANAYPQKIIRQPD